MPRSWTEYTPREQLRLRPLVERLKHARYAAKVAAGERRDPTRGDPAALARGLAGGRALVTVAFNEPRYVAWQAELVRRFLPPATHLIVDNSTDPDAADAVEAAADAQGCGYVRLRPSPWANAEDAGRAHALALNWAWRNLLRPGRPEMFGFLDHDIFPLGADDPFARLERAQVAGQVRNRSGRERWYLWAGFCFFRYDAAARTGLDFSLDWAAGLDTGGANWFRLYRRLRPGDVSDAGLRWEAVDPDLPADVARVEWIGPWMHASNFSTPLSAAPDLKARIAARKRELLETRIAAALGRGPPAR